MGLDITAYKGLVTVQNPKLDDEGYPVDWEKNWLPRHGVESEQHFPGRARGVDLEAVYTFTDSLRFRAGSYGSYNWWRDQLAKFAGYASAQDAWDKGSTGPFSELIEFSDCEGVIGPVVSAKLARDFSDHATQAERYAATMGEGGKHWFQLYRLWQSAFVMAADTGAVEFH